MCVRCPRRPTATTGVRRATSGRGLDSLSRGLDVLGLCLSRGTSEGLGCAHRGRLDQRCRGMAYIERVSRYPKDNEEDEGRTGAMPSHPHATNWLASWPPTICRVAANHRLTVPVESPRIGVPEESCRNDMLQLAQLGARLRYGCFRLHRGGAAGPRPRYMGAEDRRLDGLLTSRRTYGCAMRDFVFASRSSAYRVHGLDCITS